MSHIAQTQTHIMKNLDSLTTTTPGTGITAPAGSTLSNVTYIVETAANPPNTAIISFQALLGDGATWFTLPQGWVNTKNTVFAFGTLGEKLPTLIGVRPMLSAAVTNPILVSLHAMAVSDAPAVAPVMAEFNAVTTNQTVNCAGASSVCITFVFTAAVTLSLTNLPFGIPVCVRVQNNTAGALTFNLTATDPTGTAYANVQAFHNGGLGNLVVGLSIAANAFQCFSGGSLTAGTFGSILQFTY